MTESILSNKKECYICKTTQGLHRHHIFGGYNRKHSEEEGCWVYLCGYHHNLSADGVHHNRLLDLALKGKCQEEWEELNGDTEDFRRIFGKSWK